MEHGRAAYERDLVTQAGLSPEQAATKTKTGWARLFPDGRVAPGHELFAVEDDSRARRRPLDCRTGERRRREGAVRLFDRDRAEHRGRGLGREAMLLFENEARSRRISGASLTVLGGNEIARSLYRSLGCIERAVFMSKDVEARPAS